MSVRQSGRLELALDAPQNMTERELLAIYRESSTNDRVLLDGLLVAWASLSPAHRRIAYLVADALQQATRWRQRPTT